MNPFKREWETYKWMRSNRWKKKRRMYKMVFDLTIDRVTGTYLLFFLVLGGIIAYDQLKPYGSFFTRLEAELFTALTSVMALAIMRSVGASFRGNGILFSRGEHVMSLLPMRRERIWVLSLLSHVCLTALVVVFLCAAVALITPLSTSFLLTFGIVVIVLYGGSLLIQWRFYQFPFLLRLGLFVSFAILLALINGLSYVVFESLSYAWVPSLVVWGSLFIYSARTKFVNVDWERVIRDSDRQIWNMWVVNVVLKPVGLDTPSQNRGAFRLLRFNWWKKPFKYKSNAMYHRILGLYFYEQLSAIGSLAFVTAILLYGVAPLGKFGFSLSIMLLLLIYTTMLGSFLYSVLSKPILRTMPTNINQWVKAFSKWVYSGLAIVAIPVIYLANMTFQSYGVVAAVLLFYFVVFQQLAQLSYKQTRGVLNKGGSQERWPTVVLMVCQIVLVVFVPWQPLWISLLGLVLSAVSRLLRLTEKKEFQAQSRNV
ncbi:hypothetical protein N781_07130 [Pontibacillus halophilus JSM 076056 = DSM 19796]|uniref:Uncharacterized protein n=1 Tax=Pontibacillus halophilus JSM 076056 = DSM 19796 TaxID=1385510 RepID=A0A0A5GBN9_9BACI|nr:hypothetical protein [Pontibacillus halophilus]KGX90591.1 hypothetical protein N781_07130 [Pontibacillus halophilus JSM 076056 = DSM 19796]